MDNFKAKAIDALEGARSKRKDRTTFLLSWFGEGVAPIQKYIEDFYDDLIVEYWNRHGILLEMFGFNQGSSVTLGYSYDRDLCKKTLDEDKNGIGQVIENVVISVMETGNVPSVGGCGKDFFECVYGEANRKLMRFGIMLQRTRKDFIPVKLQDVRTEFRTPWI